MTAGRRPATGVQVGRPERWLLFSADEFCAACARAALARKL